VKQNSPPEISSPLFLEQNSGNSQQDDITSRDLRNYWEMSQNLSRQVFFFFQILNKDQKQPEQKLLISDASI